MYLCVILLLIHFSEGYQKKEYSLIDIQHCPGGENEIFAKIDITTTLFDENLLQLDMRLMPTVTSCRLCQLNPLYCNLSISNQFYGMTTGDDIQHNFRLLIEQGSEDLRFLLSSDGMSIRAIGRESSSSSSSWCGSNLKMILLVYFNLRSPISRDFLLTLANPNPDNATLQCQKFLPRTGLCHIASSFFYIDFPYTNCLSFSGENQILLPTTTNDSLSENAFSPSLMRAATKRRREKICGESWQSILRRVRLEELYCDPEILFYIKLKAWYEAAIIYITARLNGVKRKELWILSTLLEQNCHLMETEVALENTLFYPLVESWAERVVCPNMSDFMENEKNVTLPYYVRHHHQWYYQWFHYILEAKESMHLEASLLVTMPFVLSLICIIAIIITIHHIYFRKHKDFTSIQYQPLSK